MEALHQENINNENKEAGASLSQPGKKRTYSVFRFFGEALALDLVNTEITTMKGKYLDLLGDPADFARWWCEVLPYHPEITANFEKVEVDEVVIDQQFLERAKQLRQQIRQLIIKRIESKPLPLEGLVELNRVLESSYPQMTVRPNGEAQLVYKVHKDQREIILVALALSAISLLTLSKPERLRKCKNERCIGLFYDNTKSATRYWCHINCKDRARAAERYQNSKA